LAEGGRVTPEELRERRKGLGLSQASLGRALGISPNTLARWERGELRLSNPSLVRLALDGLALGSQTRATAFAGLPTMTASFIGRHAEIRALRRLCARRRLVTLSGTAGVGKTRLALEVAAQLAGTARDRTVVVELAPLREPAQVVRTLAECLRIPERSDEPLLETLTEVLGDQQLRLVFDNCEHLVRACAELVGRLLGTCPGLRVIATSRVALGVDGELVYSVPALGLPAADSATPNQLLHCEAVALFVERARSVQPAFSLTADNVAVVAEICRQLDGLPLALELAAAQMRVLAPAELLERLRDRLHLLQSDRPASPPHHRGLATTLDWSCALLSESERQLLQRLSIFAGGFTLEAVEAVCFVDTWGSVDVLPYLRRLVESSLVHANTTAGQHSRYRLLETVREYASNRLRALGESRALAERHCDWCVNLVERFELEWRGPEQQAWLRRMEEEHSNLAAAIGWCIEVGEVERGLSLAGTAWRFWEVRGYLSEGRRWLMRLLEAGGAATPARARALDAAGHLAILQGDQASGVPLIRDSLALAVQLDDRRTQANAYHSLGLAAQYQLEYAQAEEMHTASLELSRAIGDTRREYVAIYNLAVVAQKQSQFERATALHMQSLALKREIGDLWSVGYSLFNLGLLAWIRGEPQRAIGLLRQSLDLRHQLGDKPGIAACLETLAEFDVSQRQTLRAARLFGATDALLQASGVRIFTPRECGLSRDLDAVRLQLGEASFTRAYSAGKTTALAEVVAEVLSFATSGPKASTLAKPTNGLSRREFEVAALVADGLSNRQIAARLAIAEGTAQRHVANIMAKLGSQSRSEVAAWNARL
jgi:non-specific serine/threonine protein kinase